MEEKKPTKSIKILRFGIMLVQKIKRDNIPTAANALTYKILLALFPFLIFLMTLLGFFNLDRNVIIELFGKGLPQAFLDIINVFIVEVIDTRSLSILSTSLVIALFSASSGFKAVMDALNRAYEYEENRSFLLTRIISVFMVVIFAVIILTSISLLVFGDTIVQFVLKHNFSTTIVEIFYSFSTYVVAMIILVITTMIIYVLASSEKISLFSVLPGALLTVSLWIVSSKVFNIYINNFSKYSKVYGSIGSIFILMIWLNLICFFLLLGGEVNAVIELSRRN